MTEPRLQFPDEMPPGKMAHAALQIGNLCQGCGETARRSLYGKINSAFQHWEWSDVGAVLEAMRPEPGQSVEAAFAATLTKAKGGKWLRRREGGNLGQTRSATPDGTNQPEGRPGPPPDPEAAGLPLILTLHPRHTKFVSDLARDLDRMSPAQQINESHVVTAMIEACLGILADAQRRLGRRLTVPEAALYLQRYADLQRETVP